MAIPRFTLLAVFLILLVFTSNAPARLGESLEECAARYGPPVAEVPALLNGATGVVYQKGDIRIRIEYLEGKAAFISFSRRGLRGEERQALLDLNAGPQVWNPPGEFLGRVCWTAPGNAQLPARHASAYQASEIYFLDLATDGWARSMAAQQAIQFAIQPKAPVPSSAAAPSGAPAPVPAAGFKLDGF